MSWIGALFVFASLFLAPPAMGTVHQDQDNLNKDMLEALRPYGGFVGSWKGDGKSNTSSGWKEKVDCAWGFRDKDGRVSLNFFSDGKDAFAEGVLSFDPKEKEYTFVARAKDKSVLRFRGKAAKDQSLKLARTDEDYKDKFDRLEIKLAKGSDKLLLTFGKKVGRTSFESQMDLELFREGPALESFAANPKCPVTGTTGRIEVTVGDKKFHVACESCKERLLAHPNWYSNKATQP